MAVQYRQWLFSFFAGLSIFTSGLAATTITNAYLPLMILGCALSLASVLAWTKSRLSGKVVVAAQVQTEASPKRILAIPAANTAKTSQVSEMADAV